MCGSAVGVIAVLAEALHAHDWYDLWFYLFLAFACGLGIGLITGLIFGLVNGLALAALMLTMFGRLIKPRSLRNLSGVTCVTVSLVGPVLAYPKLSEFLFAAGWWAVATMASLAAIAWWASGRFCRWYLSNAVVE